MSTTRQAMLVTASHSPIIEFPEVETDAYHRVVAALDDVKRQLALCQDSRDALEITPMLLLGPPGIGKTHFARKLADRVHFVCGGVIEESGVSAAVIGPTAPVVPGTRTVGEQAAKGGDVGGFDGGADLGPGPGCSRSSPDQQQIRDYSPFARC